MSVETVYATFGSEADLLTSALEVANVEVYARLVDEGGNRHSGLRGHAHHADRLQPAVSRPGRRTTRSPTGPRCPVGDQKQDEVIQ